jgi:hypothetical protein
VKVEIHVPDDLWEQLQGRVKVSPSSNPSEWKRAMAKELRTVLAAGMGPNPRSVIHAVKAKGRGQPPPAESAEALEEVRAKIARDEAAVEEKRAAARRNRDEP